MKPHKILSFTGNKYVRIKEALMMQLTIEQVTFFLAIGPDPDKPKVWKLMVSDSSTDDDPTVIQPVAYADSRPPTALEATRIAIDYYLSEMKHVRQSDKWTKMGMLQ